MTPEIEMEQSQVAESSSGSQQEQPQQTQSIEATESKGEAAPPDSLSIHDKIAKLAADKQKRDEKSGKFQKKEASKETTPPPAAKVEEAAPGNTEEEGEVKPPAFQANFKVKVLDKEHEIPEKFRSLMTDAASEKEVRELFEKAHGLDVVKPKYQQTRQELQQVQGQHAGVINQINTLREHVSRGDFDSFFDQLRIPHERVLNWIADKVKYENLPPEQKAILDARKDAEQRAFAAERQTSTISQQMQQQMTQQVTFALQSVLARPDVKSVADAYDSRAGQQGAFEQEVRRRGDYAWRTRNELVPPETLVQEVMTLVGPASPPSAQGGQPGTLPGQNGVQAAPAPQAGTQTQQKKTPVIPNVSGRTQSALKPKPKSLDDLRQRYKELDGQA